MHVEDSIASRQTGSFRRLLTITAIDRRRLIYCMYPPKRQPGCDRYNLMIRSLEMIFMIVGRRRTYGELAEHFEVSPKTIERMANAISEVFEVHTTYPKQDWSNIEDSEVRRARATIYMKTAAFRRVMRGYQAESSGMFRNTKKR